MQDDSVPSKSLFLAGRWPFSLCPHVMERERESSGLSSSSYRDTNYIMGTPLSMTSSKPIYLPKVPPPNTITLGVRASTWEVVDDENIQTILIFKSGRCAEAQRSRKGQQAEPKS